ncbi:MAG: class I SAM-dependent methyltransferase [Lachnospirales bacterium]
MNIQWNAEEYRHHFQFVHHYGEDLLQLIDEPQGKRVVDLGCGNGALSAKLRDLGCHVTGVDASADMLGIARASYPDIPFIQGDLRTLQLDTPADVLFSNAVFHWIDARDQQRMLCQIASQLLPGGQLVCEFGGHGCAETVHAALERAFTRRQLTYPRVFYFPTIGEYTPLLEHAGFKVVWAHLFDRWTQQSTQDGLSDWIHMFVKKPFENLSENVVTQIIQEANEELRPVLYQEGHWYIDYVRIRIKAIKEVSL